jgi:hypothetical protein
MGSVLERRLIPTGWNDDFLGAVLKPFECESRTQPVFYT